MSELFSSENGTKAYQLVRNLDDRKDIKDYCETQWTEFKPLCGNQKEFVSQFPNNFVERWWELRVFRFLTNNRLDVIKSDKAGPDFKIKLNDTQFLWVECVSPGVGENEENKVREIQINPITKVGVGSGNYDDQAMLRVGGSLTDKAKTFLRYMESGIIGENDICLLAIDISQLRGYDDPPGDPNLLFKILTGIHSLQLVMDLETSETNYKYSRKLPVKTRSNDTDIELDWQLPEIDKTFKFNGFLYNSCPFVVPTYDKLDYISINDSFNFTTDKFLDQIHTINRANG